MHWVFTVPYISTVFILKSVWGHTLCTYFPLYNELCGVKQVVMSPCSFIKDSPQAVWPKPILEVWVSALAFWSRWFGLCGMVVFALRLWWLGLSWLMGLLQVKSLNINLQIWEQSFYPLRCAQRLGRDNPGCWLLSCLMLCFWSTQNLSFFKGPILPAC